MNLQLITRMLESATDVNIQALLDDDTTVFWIDWRQDDGTIAEACENVLKTGTLRSELADAETPQGHEVHIHYADRKGKVPLTYTAADRHITIWSLNEMLSPDYEIRFCIDSTGGDTLAFLPLAIHQWRELESHYGHAVAKHFYRIAAHPNVFTDPLPLQPVEPIVTGRNARVVRYHEYSHALGMSAMAFLDLLDRPRAEVAARVKGLVDKSAMATAELPPHKVRLMNGETVDEVHQWPDLALQFVNDRLAGTIMPTP